jgi:hypothetical protein
MPSPRNGRRIRTGGTRGCDAERKGKTILDLKTHRRPLLSLASVTAIVTAFPSGLGMFSDGTSIVG